MQESDSVSGELGIVKRDTRPKIVGVPRMRYKYFQSLFLIMAIFLKLQPSVLSGRSYERERGRRRLSERSKLGWKS